MAVPLYYARLYYNANGGSGATSGYTQGYTDEPEMTASVPVNGGTPTKQYFTFNGWAFSASASGGYANGSSVNLRTSATAGGYTSYTVYATWTHQNAQVIFNANGGSGAPSTINHWAGYSVTIPDTIPTRSGYTFLGWSKSSTATTATYYPGKDYALYTTVTLYAVWQQNDYIYVNVNGTWKKAIPYVKVNGTWKKTTKSYVKVNGTWRSL